MGQIKTLRICYHGRFASFTFDSILCSAASLRACFTVYVVNDLNYVACNYFCMKCAALVRRSVDITVLYSYKSGIFRAAPEKLSQFHLK